jgi:Predicted carbamoyl transferase, NodU family
MPVWLKEKLFLKTLLQDELAAVANGHTTTDPPKDSLFLSTTSRHAASAFFPSPFEKAVVLCMGWSR